MRKQWAFKRWAFSGAIAVEREFSIVHDPTLTDKMLAEMQAKWREKVLAEEYERGPDSVC